MVINLIRNCGFGPANPGLTECFLDLLAYKLHGCDYGPTARPVQAQSMLRKANIGPKRLILRRKEGHESFDRFEKPGPG